MSQFITWCNYDIRSEVWLRADFLAEVSSEVPQFTLQFAGGKRLQVHTSDEEIDDSADKDAG